MHGVDDDDDADVDDGKVTLLNSVWGPLASAASDRISTEFKFESGLIIDLTLKYLSPSRHSFARSLYILYAPPFLIIIYRQTTATGDLQRRKLRQFKLD